MYRHSKFSCLNAPSGDLKLETCNLLAIPIIGQYNINMLLIIKIYLKFLKFFCGPVDGAPRTGPGGPRNTVWEPMHYRNIYSTKHRHYRNIYTKETTTQKKQLHNRNIYITETSTQQKHVHNRNIYTTET